ncbi:AAA family ATPase [Paraburkholderia youngii]|uniref:AAA family ATPase n=1 Tax=Paraburkholderia youngii TaxID=2782701 RepID=A0A7Y6MYR6_9BURK|nr:AAA family ATPase [Paraburkholderia youngii]NUX99538.1 AAA family ATPase [Paraburkholderia youngii]
MSSENTGSYIVTARYRTEDIPHYKGNQLIEALPRSPDTDEWHDFLWARPKFDPKQREWPPQQRFKMIARLLNFHVPLERHIRLAHAIDTIIREGYVGRVPRTASHVAILQQLYEARQAGHILRSDGMDEQDFAQRSSSFVGVSGIGKTTTLLRILDFYFPAIFHPELGVTQIPWLHVEAPADGTSVKGLATAIQRQLKALAPDAVPYKDISSRKYANETIMMNDTARLMHLCNVGLLIVDEIHRLKYDGKGKLNLLNVLVAASNELGVPVLFVGTSKASKLLGLDFSPGRRSVGSGFTPWNLLEATHNFEREERGEWEHFIEAFWPLQWLRKPTELNPELSKLMYAYCQGLVDIALKLFVAVQLEAIFDGSETITEQGIKRAWENHFTLIHPMIAACQSGDKTALEQYQDIAPIEFELLLQQVKFQYQSPRDPSASLRPGDKNFAPAVANQLVSSGMEPHRALEKAKQVELKGKAKNVHEATKAALVGKTIPTHPSKRKAKADSAIANPDLAPDDYRLAIRAAREEGCSVFSKLRSMGALFDFDASLEE